MIDPGYFSMIVIKDAGPPRTIAHNRRRSVLSLRKFGAHRRRDASGCAKQNGTGARSGLMSEPTRFYPASPNPLTFVASWDATGSG